MRFDEKRVPRLDGSGEDTVIIADGPDVRPPLICLHGVSSNAASFDDVIGIFARDRRVIAPDLPGYGNSDPLPWTDPTPIDAGYWVWDMLSRLEVEGPIDLLGHSLGSLNISGAALLHPERVRRMVLADPGRGHAVAAPPWPAGIQGRLDALTRYGPLAYADDRAGRMCAPIVAPEALAKVHRQLTRLTVPGLTAGCAILAQGHLSTMLERLKTMGPMPTLICGTDDRITPYDEIAALAASLDLPILPMPGVGHAGYFENADLYAETVLQALGG